MRFALLPLVDEPAWLKLTEAERGVRIADFGKYVEALTNEGVLIGAFRPEPSVAAKTVRVVNGETQVLDGPHADAKEQLGGLCIIDVPDLDAALSWAALNPAAGFSVVEVRPIQSPRP